MNKPRNLAEDYLKWLSDNLTETRLSNGLLEISTPYLDRFNDGIVVYASEKGGTITYFDDMALFNNTIGISGTASKKKIDALRSFMETYGAIVADDGEVQMSCSQEQAALRLHIFIHAILAGNDMFAPRHKQTASQGIFLNDVADFLDSSNVSYNKDVNLEGKSGIMHQIGFLIPGNKIHLEKLVYALNKPTAQNVQLTLFNWQDIQNKRGKSNMIAFLNDDEQEPSDNLMQAFRAYHALPVPWSQKEKFLEDFAV